MEEINALRDMGTYTDGAKDAVEIAIEDTRHFEKTDPEFEALAIYITMEDPETDADAMNRVKAYFLVDTSALLGELGISREMPVVQLKLQEIAFNDTEDEIQTIKTDKRTNKRFNEDPNAPRVQSQGHSIILLGRFQVLEKLLEKETIEQT
ncbi:hypothetical protein DPMN_155383 [Dreissena polymorpha]|uniref:Uncharacterized protein n=1 Tax=Dreissena polymorpha TaxID=45954 RepID=A0A9D4FTL8_DREPO|nr:hypothetical protein DPMN_155383 [Dreissena polymorpha]